MSRVVVCARRVEGEVPPHPLAEATTCSGCSCSVWIAPSGRRLLEGGEGVAICMSCIPREMSGQEILMAPGATDELEDVGGPDLKHAALRVVDSLNRRRHGRFTGQPFSD